MLNELKEQALLGLELATLSSVVWLARYLRTNLNLHMPRNEALEAASRRDMEINIILDRCLVKFNAQRVYLSRFHNGDSYLDGSSILRKSRTNEQVRPGMSYQAEVFRGMLITHIPEEMKLIAEPGPSWTLVSELCDGKLKWLCTEGGVRAVARCAVRRGTDLVGFVGADFDSESRPQALEELCASAKRIGDILNAFPGRKKSLWEFIAGRVSR